jgi:hypothetical protein
MFDEKLRGKRKDDAERIVRRVMRRRTGGVWVESFHHRELQVYFADGDRAVDVAAEIGELELPHVTAYAIIAEDVVDDAERFMWEGVDEQLTLLSAFVPLGVREKLRAEIAKAIKKTLLGKGA